MTVRLICVDSHSLSGKKDMSQWFAKGLREAFQVLDEPLPGFAFGGAQLEGGAQHSRETCRADNVSALQPLGRR